jgi:hypothetical protein
VIIEGLPVGGNRVVAGLTISPPFVCPEVGGIGVMVITGVAVMVGTAVGVGVKVGLGGVGDSVGLGVGVGVVVGVGVGVVACVD